MMQRAAEFSGIPVGELYSIVTFYAQFRLEPIGKNLIQVCHGTACHLAGAEKITESLQFETKAQAGGPAPTAFSPWKRWPAWDAAAWLP